MAKNKERKVRTYAVKIYYTALQSEEGFEAVAESFIKYNNVDRQVADQSIALIRASLCKKILPMSSFRNIFALIGA